MTKAIKEKEKILEFTFHLSDIVKKENWASHYDVDSDSFALVSPKLSDDARKEYVDDEFAFYFTKDRKIQGIFIEYFKSNFLAHNKKSKYVLTSNKKRNQSLINIKKETTKRFTSDLELLLKESLLQNFQIKLVA